MIYKKKSRVFPLRPAPPPAPLAEHFPISLLSLAGESEKEIGGVEPAPISGGLSFMGLHKMRSWSPDYDREEAWLRRRTIHRDRRGRTRSVTDEDLDELRGCIDLGFGFDAEEPAAVAASARRLSETLPALNLYYAVHRGLHGSSPPSDSASSSEGSAASPDFGSPVSFFSPGESPEERKARLKRWAQVVAFSVRQRC